jgi:uncharacterized protein
MISSNPFPAFDFEVVRDPLWNTIRLDPTARRIIDTLAFQRLRHIRQLGHAFLVYPGATHTRFDHALGVYHLARRALQLLSERGDLAEVDPLDCRVLPYAALLHDIGHYPFSHALEELSPEHVPVHHEQLTGSFLRQPELGGVLAEVGEGSVERIEAMIRGRGTSPVRGLVSGSLDLDKIEYLNRDAMFCGVPYGVVDVDRLLHALTVLRDPESGELEVGVYEKGLSALESLLFAKYQMFRNVYWHHAVRAATVLYKRVVEEAVDGGLITPGELVGRTDDALVSEIEARAQRSDGPEGGRLRERWLPALRGRRLPKRALELPGEAARGLPLADWLYADAPLRRAVEDRMAQELDLPSGSVFIDYPEKPRMMGLDLLLLQRDGETRRLSQQGYPGLIDLPRVADQLYHSARVLRVFTTERRQLSEQPLLDLLQLAPEALSERIAQPLPHR